MKCRRLSIACLVLLISCALPSARGFVYTVTVTNDSGGGSLRSVITAANSTLVPDTINFNIPTVPPNSMVTLELLSALPAITNTVTIDGFSQVGGGGCQPGVELTGASLPAPGTGNHGLVIRAPDCQIRGLIINRFPANGILMDAAAIRTYIVGNYIGTDSSGTADAGNGGNGIVLFNSADNHIGATPLTNCQTRNIISGNGGNGVRMLGAGAMRNSLQNNYIGTDVSGYNALPNDAHGVCVELGANNNFIGSSAAPKPVNVISGNATNGVCIGTNAPSNQVLGNHIGVARDGFQPLGNGEDGVYIVESQANLVGDSSGEARNIIAANGDDGVELRGTNSIGNFVQGNYIGITTGGVAIAGNQDNGVVIAEGGTQNMIGGALVLARNIISGNLGNGIQLIDGPFGNFIYGNYVGLSADGMVGVSNRHHGISMLYDASDNWIGSVSTANSGNMISGNGANGDCHGICLEERSDGNEIARNVIGLNLANIPVPNRGNGVTIRNCSGNEIAHGAMVPPNVISGNRGHGVLLGSNALGNAVNGALIGMDTNRIIARPNGGEGILIFRSELNDVGNSGTPTVICGNQGSGIKIVESRGNHINWALIGFCSVPPWAMGNSDYGVHVVSSPSNYIGSDAGTTVISGNNRDGVLIEGPASRGNVILGCSIGSDPTFTMVVSNRGNGVVLDDAPNNMILGTGVYFNVISGNLNDGIVVRGDLAVGNVIRGNRIGMGVFDTLALPNGQNGVLIWKGAHGTKIGGLRSNDGNRVAFNTGAGIRILGPEATNNSILGNAIYSNALLGIDLDAVGVSPNDDCDPDPGANFLQNFPELWSATTNASGQLELSWGYNVIPSAEYHFEFFLTDKPDASGYGEGRTLIGSTNKVATSCEGYTMADPFAVSVRTGMYVTATATDTNGNTSEFSLAVPVVPNEAFDTDGDGMPDSWENLNGLNPYIFTGDDGATGNPDGDPAPNYEEYIADTSPRDTSNYFHIVAFEAPTNNIVTYSSTNSRYYLVAWSSVDMSGFWPLMYYPALQGSSNTTSYKDLSSVQSNRIYRVSVQLAP